MHAEIISIGDELTSGKLLDTNSQWLALELESKGVRTLCHTTIADELDAMTVAFAQAGERSDIVIITGGLGPTDDDLTRQALADAFHRELEFRPEMFAWVKQVFARRNRPMPEKNRVQAYFPAGSKVIDNPTGTAPGILLERQRPGRGPCRLYALPGVPSEMKIMYAQSVEPDILKRANQNRQVIIHRKINTFGAGESQVEKILGDLIQRGRVPRVGITASQADISLRIMGEAPTLVECQNQIQPTIDYIYQKLDGLIFGEQDETIFDALLAKLARKKQRIAVIECGTGGLLAAQFRLAQEKYQEKDEKSLDSGKTSDVGLPAPGPFAGGLVVESFDAAVQLFPQFRNRIDQIQKEDANSALDWTIYSACWTCQWLDVDAVLSVSHFPPSHLERAGNMYIALATRRAQQALISQQFGGSLAEDSFYLNRKARAEEEFGMYINVQAWPHSGTPEILPILACKRAANLALRAEF